MAAAGTGPYAGGMTTDGMMGGLLVGTGWLGLFACIVLGGIARVPLQAAGARRAEGRPWGVPAAVGFGLLAVALLAALSALGSFFGIMGLAFAAITGLGGWQAFHAGERARRHRQAQLEHADRLGRAFRGATGAGSGAAQPPPAPPSARPADPTPAWYPRDDEEGRRP